MRIIDLFGWSDFRSSNNWEIFDIRQAFGEECICYTETFFDGRYLYYGTERNNEGAHCKLLRYDTSSPFGNLSSWEMFDASVVAGERGSFISFGFDGRYLYLMPYYGGLKTVPKPFYICLRYDTKASFSDPLSWQKFDLRLLNTGLYGFVGAKVVNGALYIAPYQTCGKKKSCTFLRYKCADDFTDVNSWKTFDSINLNSEAKGYMGIESDGIYIYSSPCFNQNKDAVNSIMLRYDTRKEFVDMTSWETLDIAAVKNNSNLGGYHGSMAFDGKFIYYTPLYRPPKPDSIEDMHHGMFVRYNTQRSFLDPESWQVFDSRKVKYDACGYSGGGFDGRYIYACPVRCCSHNLHGRVLRYDTFAPFEKASSFEVKDLEKINPRLVYFDGVASYDGNFMYFAPASHHGLAVRFKSRTAIGKLVDSLCSQGSSLLNRSRNQHCY